MINADTNINFSKTRDPSLNNVNEAINQEDSSNSVNAPSDSIIKTYTARWIESLSDCVD